MGGKDVTGCAHLSISHCRLFSSSLGLNFRNYSNLVWHGICSLICLVHRRGCYLYGHGTAIGYQQGACHRRDLQFYVWYDVRIYWKLHFLPTIFTYRCGIHDRCIGFMIMLVYMYIVASPCLACVFFNPCYSDRLWYFDRHSDCHLRSNLHNCTIHRFESHRKAFPSRVHQRRRKNNTRKSLL